MRKKDKLYALLDCNNFYASCERVFQPNLEDKPIIVLSNNDGCVVARSEEAKKLGIEMAIPFFKVKNLCRKHQVQIFSSNYQYYGDMSRRVMNILSEFTPETEIYSIDEAFLCFPNRSGEDINSYCLYLKELIKKWTGIPVSIGVGKTKTLAKLANHIAKKHTQSGIFQMPENDKLADLLSKIPISNIWGIGQKWSIKMNQSGIYSGLDLQQTDSFWLRKNFTVVGQRIQQELSGISCLELEDIKPKKNILSSRSFGRPVYSLRELKEAITSYASRACFKLRQDQQITGFIYVFVKTNKFKNNHKQYYNSASYSFNSPTNDSFVIIAKAIEAITKIFKEGVEYKKAGIILSNLSSENNYQNSLFSESKRSKTETRKLMQTIDYLNHKFGNDTAFSAAQGIKQNWRMNCENRSNRYTTNWHEILKIN